MFKIPWPWWWYWCLWKLFDVLAFVFLNLQEPSIELAIEYATKCYVTGGPQSTKEYLDAMLPPKEEPTP